MRKASIRKLSVETAESRRRRESASEIRIECPHCGTTLDSTHLDASLYSGWPRRRLQLRVSHLSETFDQVIDRLTYVLVLGALEEANGIKVHAAKILGIKRNRFDQLVDRLGITSDEIAKIKETAPNTSIAIDIDHLHVRGLDRGAERELRLRLHSADGNLDGILNRAKHALVLKALQNAGGVQKDAAEMLGVKRSTFNYLVRRLKIGKAELRDEVEGRTPTAARAGRF